MYVYIETCISNLRAATEGQIDGLEQYCSNSSALSMELVQSCTKPWKYLAIDIIFCDKSYMDKNFSEHASA